ncbi:hypothetical protein ACPPVO_37305 [Dactylosporangium sp. McL0621]|uniref:hypothetical protein n=1 Tax=Dactylosporangium sp. McL0621 TaxID=3415678 RepID=UPI003CEDA12C
MPEPAVRVEDATQSYGAEPVLAGVGGTVAPGAVVARIGPNGAGKSTLSSCTPRCRANRRRRRGTDRAALCTVFTIVGTLLRYWRGGLTIGALK